MSSSSVTSTWRLLILLFEFTFELAEVEAILVEVSLFVLVEVARSFEATMNDECVVENAERVASDVHFARLTDSVEAVLSKSLVE